MAGIADDISASAGLEASFTRRGEEWQLQVDLALRELDQINQQILAAEVREQIAEHDLEVFEKNVDQMREQLEFVEIGKFSKLGLFDWMAARLSRLYRQAFSLAYEMARLAELASHFERGDESSVFIESQAAYWAPEQAGLLAGEALLVQLQTCERAYLTSRAHDYEITKHISLAMLDPAQLIFLRETGSCDFEVPELLFQLDFPSHANRRIKSVSLTIPCVAGPYTSVSATLTLLRHFVRLPDQALTEDLTDLTDLTALEASGRAKIATSSAQNDSGMFELNFRDERYLPFEGAGAISHWRLELNGKWLLEPAAPCRPFRVRFRHDWRCGDAHALHGAGRRRRVRRYGGQPPCPRRNLAGGPLAHTADPAIQSAPGLPAGFPSTAESKRRHPAIDRLRCRCNAVSFLPERQDTGASSGRTPWRRDGLLEVQGTRAGDDSNHRSQRCNGCR
jgi:hypothetical protein